MESKEIQIHKVVEGYHPRKDVTGLGELKEQIQRNGLKEPLRVRTESHCFVVIDGNRRLSVLRELGYETVPCFIEEIDERSGAHLSYVLNAGDYRKNLNPLEVSLHMKEMRERFGYSVRELIDLGVYGTNDQTIYNKLSLLTLPQEIQEKIAEGKICPTVGYKLAGVKDPDLQSKGFQVLEKVRDRSVRKTEKIINNLIDSVDRDKDEKQVPITVPEGDIPGVFFHDSNHMSEFEDGTIHLIIVSPNYGVGMEYEDGVSFEGHLKDLERCVPEWGRKLMS
jgi:ParB family transcriptional regulator, chromosome partitioning protein